MESTAMIKKFILCLQNFQTVIKTDYFRNGASLPIQLPISGYFLNTKRNSDSWEEISLDYDMLDYKLSNLSCGSVYSFNLVAHNIAGRSKPSATITTPTLGSIPQNVNTDRIITGVSNRGN